MNDYLNELCNKANINNKISRLETHITRFKSADYEYDKIKITVEEEVIIVLTDGKVIL
jgi:AMMECR1 domain-containing protein